ncbi:hypothetical protein PYCCODRAFT_1425371 [Trametes coccinea BRFM310]|uniref:Fungal-type protein kinase domain-containing protein n=1 Tax=Trametes coccinea (strain BRFM310) TaxID=1353009 RepID=A0A1Y2IMA1_TRAC3|nr:hypothetical protein PYCCODRAFT_1425371 [Trametes coccinea BRFM310]
MASHVHTEPPLLPVNGIHYRAPSGYIQTSPHKFEKLSNRDTRKHATGLKPNVAIDRPLLGVSSMGHTILVDLSTFEKEILRVRPGLEAIAALPQNLVDDVRTTLKWLFIFGASPTEDAIATKFVQILNTKVYGGLLKKHSAAFTGTKASRDGCTAKVDAGLYPQDHTPPAGNPDWTHIRLFIEFKRQGTSLDPFDDDDPSAPEAEAQSRTAVRNQILDYARIVHEYQHRVCIFGLFVIGPEFRLMRFDHSGIIVTKKENYAQNPRPLLSFLAWFDSLSDEDQGLDPTAMLLKKGSRAYRLMDAFAEKNDSDLPYNEGDTIAATPPPSRISTPAPKPDVPARNTRQQTKAAAAISNMDESYLDAVELVSEDYRVFKFVRDQFRESVENDWPRYMLEVGRGEEKRIFLVGKPVWTAFWLFGRGTRGYVALDVKTRRFMFLKDCWRPFYEGVEPEGCYLELLNEEALRNSDIKVPTVIAHGDVAGQVTLAASYAPLSRPAGAKAETRSSGAALPPLAPVGSGPGATHDHDDSLATTAPSSDHNVQPDCDNRVYRHYRIVLKDVCLPFTAVRSSKQLVQCLYDCIATHAAAYETLRLLHRDISAGNVIILPALSTEVNEDGQRTVTWTGILTDWELAKFVPEPDASGKWTETPRQPERTGTWQFMSVAYIENHPHKPVSVADELESFFHVLLFYAVRMLRHNVTDVRFFITDYFDSFTVASEAGRDCSSTKSAVMRSGALRVGRLRIRFLCVAPPSNDPPKVKIDIVASKAQASQSRGQEQLDHSSKDESDKPANQVMVDDSPPTVLEHPLLNQLFATLLAYFKARYAILEWEAQNPVVLQRPSNNAFTASKTTSAHRPGRPRPRTIDTTQMAPPSIPQPSQEDQTLAKVLDDHTGILNDIWEALEHADWPEDDVVQDRLPDNYDPRPLILAYERMCTKSLMRTIDQEHQDAPPRKKPRTDASEPTVSSTAMLPPKARTVDAALGNPSGRVAEGKARAKGKGEGKAEPYD